jgi:hypothetical protein
MRIILVKELINLFLGVLSRGSLLCGNVRESHQYGRVDGTCIIEEASNDLLDALFTSIKERTLVGRCRCLIVLSISDRVRRVGTMLWFVRRGMSIMGKLLHDIFWHRKINAAFVVTPLKVDATE